ncbi:MAG: hypothetical protein H0V48_00840 [Nocardioidaceae bacterium]|nr:hypothetical protein [Nocardioidaceae bacterium]
MFGALSWGLRRYAWLVLLFVAGIGVLVPVMEARAAPVYEAKAVVAVKGALELPNLDSLPKTGDLVFRSGAVADSVRFALELPPSAAVTPSKVELVAGQDIYGFEIIGRSTDAETAATTADVAAAAFVIELNELVVGEFFIQNSAGVPTNSVQPLGGDYVAIAIGIIAGAIAGIGAVALLLVIRHPVVDAASAEDVTGAPVMGRVGIPTGRSRVDEQDVTGIAPLCRRLLESSADVILLASPTKRTNQRHKLAWALSSVLGKIRRTRLVSGGRTTPPTSGRRQDGHPVDLRAVAQDDPRDDLVVIDGPSLDQVAGRSPHALTLLLVPEGIGAGALREIAEQYLDGGPTGLVLVRPTKRRPFSRHAKAEPNSEPMRVGRSSQQPRTGDGQEPVDDSEDRDEPKSQATATVRAR